MAGDVGNGGEDEPPKPEAEDPAPDPDPDPDPANLTFTGCAGTGATVVVRDGKMVAEAAATGVNTATTTSPRTAMAAWQRLAGPGAPLTWGSLTDG
jgi:hypothetical protein